tara:strand:+ start:1321 stop:1509 length:189 start_codon:yes stop_codon:yes gene_type:complete
MERLDQDGKKVSWLTQEIYNFILNNELNVDSDTDYDLINSYIKQRFKIDIGKQALINRIKRL